MRDDYVRNPLDFIQKINEEFATKNEAIFNLMIEGDDNTFDNLGIAYFHLSDIKTANREPRQYFAEDLKKNREYLSRIYTGKSKLSSAFSVSTNTYIYFEAWFLSDFPDIIDFGEKKKKSEIGDKIPIQIKPYYEKGIDSFHDKFGKLIAKTFIRYTNYSYKDRMFMHSKAIDQYKNSHLLPYFLSVISLPAKLYTKEDMSKDPNFFNSNINTLDEVAHFTRCFPYPSEQEATDTDIWASPDFMLKIRKGSLEDHTILMASLMLGLKKTKSKIKYHREDNPDETILTRNPLEITKNGISPTGDIIVTHQYEKQVFPYENRVFVCLGKLKYSKIPYMWVMTISDDYRDVIFWDPKVNQKFELKGRIENQDKMRNFLNGYLI